MSSREDEIRSDEGASTEMRTVTVLQICHERIARCVDDVLAVDDPGNLHRMSSRSNKSDADSGLTGVIVAASDDAAKATIATRATCEIVIMILRRNGAARGR